ncbi:hypothetical protein FQA23_0008220, partial [Aptenodytes patagonicus]
DQTWVCVGPSCSSELAPGQTPGCGDAVPAERVRANCGLGVRCSGLAEHTPTCLLPAADKTAQCEAYRQTISSLQAQLRAA